MHAVNELLILEFLKIFYLCTVRFTSLCACVYSSVGFSPWMDSCNHHCKQVQGNPNIPKESLVLPLCGQDLPQPLDLVPGGLGCPECHINRVVQDKGFGVSFSDFA